MRQDPETKYQSVPAVRSPGWLRECLVDGDETAMLMARRARRRALAVSLALQFSLVAAAVLVPLFATVATPGLRGFIPVQAPPRLGPADASRSRGGTPRHGANRPHARAGPTFPVYTPPRIPPGIVTTDNSAAESLAPPDIGPQTGSGSRDGVPGGTGTGNALSPPIRVPSQPTQDNPPDSRKVRVSEGVQQAMLIHRVEPTYPPLARQIHLEGTVHLHAIVDRDGRVRDLELLDGPILLAKSALDAVRQWRYRPTILNGEPVEVETYITVVFRLGQ